MLYKFIREIQKEEKIKAIVLAEMVGISRKHLYSYLNGNAGMSGEKEWALIEAMEELAPGSRLKLGMAIAGPLNLDQQATLLNLIAQSMRSDRAKEQINSEAIEKVTEQELLSVS